MSQAGAIDLLLPSHPLKRAFYYPDNIMLQAHW